MTNVFDSYLLFRVRTKRDPEAFARIYDRDVEAIYRYAFLKLPSKEDAQDVTAETFTRAWQYVSQQHEVTHIRALLYRIVKNLIADHYRKTGDVIVESVTFHPDSTSTVIEHESDKGGGQALIEARADLSLILQRLDRLKEDYRDVVTLRLIDDLPFSVIGEIIEKKPGHVRVMFHRALKALQETDTQDTKES